MNGYDEWPPNKALPRIVALLMCGAACASVYDYRYTASSGSPPTLSDLSERLSAVLEPQGFERLMPTDAGAAPQSGDTGYRSCPEPGPLVVFLRSDPGRTSVHLFTCQNQPRFVVIADSGVPGEPEQTHALLSKAFRPELEASAVTVNHRYRLALE